MTGPGWMRIHRITRATQKPHVWLQEGTWISIGYKSSPFPVAREPVRNEAARHFCVTQNARLAREFVEKHRRTT